MITIKVGQIKPVTEVINVLSADAKLTPKFKYWIFRFLGKLKAELGPYNEAMKIWTAKASAISVIAETDPPEAEAAVEQQQQELDKEFTEFMLSEISFDMNKIKLNVSDIPESMNASMLFALADILDVEEDGDEGRPPLQIIEPK